MFRLQHQTNCWCLVPSQPSLLCKTVRGWVNTLRDEVCTHADHRLIGHTYSSTAHSTARYLTQRNGAHTPISGPYEDSLINLDHLHSVTDVTDLGLISGQHKTEYAIAITVAGI